MVEDLTPLAHHKTFYISAPQLKDGTVPNLYVVGPQLQAAWEQSGHTPLLTLTTEDDLRGRATLAEMGVAADEWFVSLHVRYSKSKLRNAQNADIHAYYKAIEAITQRGGWALRMGGAKMPPLPPMERVIDYAHSPQKSDWMDVFLWAKCRFFVGVASGPSSVVPTFGVPCVETNWSPAAIRHWYKDNLMIHKMYWSKQESRLLTFEEILTSQICFASDINYLASIGIEVVDNTADEIYDVVVEMLDRLEGKLEYTPEDEALQLRYSAYNQIIQGHSRLGRDFLRKYAHLI